MDLVANDSIIYKEMLQNDENIDIDTITDILIQCKGKDFFNVDLLIRFYILQYINDDEIIPLYNLLDYLNCSKIKKLYFIIYNNKELLSKLDVRHIYYINYYLTTFKKVFSKYKYCVGLREDGQITTWITNKDYIDNYNISDKFVDISCGQENTIALKENNKVVIFGFQTNFGNYSYESSGEFIDIACGYNFIIGIQKNGYLNNISKEKIILPSFKFIKIACGIFHIVGIKEDGSIITFGNCRHGQEWNSPTEGKFIEIACGSYHSVAIREDGKLFTWGDNSNLQYQNLPDGKFIKIACGNYHSVGIREDGKLFIWGSNTYNQYDNLPLDGRFIQIACGSYHSAAIRGDGKLFVWGDRKEKQRKDIPEGKFIKISCGEYHSAAIREDGKLFIFGNNDYYQRLPMPPQIS